VFEAEDSTSWAPSMPQVDHRRWPRARAYREALALAGTGMRPLQAHCHHGLGTCMPGTVSWSRPVRNCPPPCDLVLHHGDAFWLPQAEGGAGAGEQ